MPARSQESTQFWPEIDTYIKLDPTFRLFFIATTSNEAKQTIGSETGANLDIFLKPIFKPKHLAIFRLDQAQSRLMTFRIGYRYLTTPGEAPENRGVMEVTSRFPLVRGTLVSDRSRVDLRTIDGRFSWRYRNQVNVQRSFGIRSYHITPYVRAEIYYDSIASKWSRTTEDAGCVFPILRRAEIEPYYEHMNDTSKSPDRQTNAIGLTLSLYF